jgi:Arc/MetJ-type ribon-helix-helix transcriptional regulator
MERFTISLSEDLAKEFDELIHKKGYQNRSEAVRDMLRDMLKTDRLERAEAPYCVAAARCDLPAPPNLQHQHHQLVLSHARAPRPRQSRDADAARPHGRGRGFHRNALIAEPQVKHGASTWRPWRWMAPARQHHHLHYRPRN